MSAASASTTTVSSPTIAYWRGVIDVQGLLDISEVTVKIFQYLQHPDASGTNFEKLKGHDVYSIRVNKKARILFTDYIQGGKKYLLLLDYLPNHEYGSSKFLKSGGVKNFRNQIGGAVSQSIQAWDNPSKEDLSRFKDLSVESSSPDFPIDYFNSTVISLNTTQERTLNTKLPALISGPPGSGKTCVALSIITNYMSDPSNHNEKSIAFVCFSENLAQTVKRNWQELPASQYEGTTNITFISYERLLDQHVEERRKVSEEESSDWFESNMGAINLDPKLVIEELQILSSVGKEEYAGLGSRQCHFHEREQKGQIVYLFEQYKSWLDDQSLYDIRFEKDEYRRCDLVVVDEAQDLSPTALMNLSHLAGRNIAYFMDTHQDLEDSLSKRDQLRQLMYSHEGSLEEIQLPTVYRCPQSVIQLANRWLDIKAHVLGGIGDKNEYRRIDVEASQMRETGNISWIKDDFEGDFEVLKRPHKETEIAVVVPDEKSKQNELFRETEISQLQLFTPEEIKGLEFDLVILFLPFQSETFKNLNTGLRGIEPEGLKTNSNRPKKTSVSGSAGSSSLRPDMNKIFTTLTRSKDTLVIYQPEKHENKHIYRLLEPLCSTQVCDGGSSSARSSEESITTKEDWLKLAKKLFDQGYHRKFNQACERAGVDPEDYKNELLGSQVEGDGAPASSGNRSAKEPVIEDYGAPASSGNRSAKEPVIEDYGASASSGNQPKAKTRGKKRRKNQKNGKSKTPKKTGAIQSNEPVKKMKIKEKDLDKVLTTGNIDKINNLFKTYSVNCRTKKGESALMRAILKKNIDAVKLLLEMNADVDASIKNGSTVLMSAALQDDVAFVNALLKKGAKVNLQTDNGLTAVMGAAFQGHVEIVNALLEKGANVNLQNSVNETALMWAAKTGHVEIVNVLLENGANVNSENYEGDTALTLAAENGYRDVVNALLEKGQCVNSPGGYADTALMIASQKGHYDLVTFLLEKGADVNLQNSVNKTALMLAAENGHIDVVNALLENNANFNLRDSINKTASMLAGENHHRDVVAALVQKITTPKML
jgi:ankyrin repeat protein